MKLIFGELEKKINNRTILNRQLFSFNYGKIYLIKGESGSGKTTFLNIITGIDNQFEGEVVFNKLDKNKDLFFVHQKMDFFGKTSIKNWMLIFKNQFNSNYDLYINNILNTDIDKFRNECMDIVESEIEIEVSAISNSRSTLAIKQLHFIQHVIV